MRHVKLLFMILGLTFILTACGNPVKAKLHETNSGFNAQITGKTKHKKVYWQIGDTIHTTKTTDDAFAFEVPYKAKQYRITLADNEEMRNPTYVEGPVAKKLCNGRTLFRFIIRLPNKKDWAFSKRIHLKAFALIKLTATT